MQGIFDFFPQANLFTSRLNYQTSIYYSWIPNSQSIGVDAFAQGKSIATVIILHLIASPSNVPTHRTNNILTIQYPEKTPIIAQA